MRMKIPCRLQDDERQHTRHRIAHDDSMDSMVTDLLFLRRFYGDPVPWRNLRALHESVLVDFAPAHRLGFTLHTRD